MPSLGRSSRRFPTVELQRRRDRRRKPGCGDADRELASTQPRHHPENTGGCSDRTGSWPTDSSARRPAFRTTRSQLGSCSSARAFALTSPAVPAKGGDFVSSTGARQTRKGLPSRGSSRHRPRPASRSTPQSEDETSTPTSRGPGRWCLSGRPTPIAANCLSSHLAAKHCSDTRSATASSSPRLGVSAATSSRTPTRSVRLPTRLHLSGYCGSGGSSCSGASDRTKHALLCGAARHGIPLSRTSLRATFPPCDSVTAPLKATTARPDEQSPLAIARSTSARRSVEMLWWRDSLHWMSSNPTSPTLSA